MTSPPRWARALVAWTLAHGRLVWAVALLLAIPATMRTAQLYLHLRSDFEALLPRESASVLAIDELRARTGGLQYLGVLDDVGAEKNLPPGQNLIAPLAARLPAYPPPPITTP